MSMFTICTTFVEEGELETALADLAAAEKIFTREIGVISRHFYQCKTQPHVIWANTEWESENHHNNAAQSLMKTRRDDRFAAISFGPDPYFEIFCEEEKELRLGELTGDLGHIVVVRGQISAQSRESFLKLRAERTAEMADRIHYLRTYHNTYAPDEFVSILGFRDEESFQKVRDVGELQLEEYLFTGLRNPMGMSYIAGYNQFVCTPLPVKASVGS